jgi:two-component system sensor histidine kinase CreC
LNELVGAIDAMRTELEGKAHVEKLAQTLTHELKSPLTAIRAATELLRDDLPPADRDRFLDSIESQTERLQHLATQMLLLARLEAAAETPSRQPVSLEALIREAMAHREADCRRRSLNWRLESDLAGTVVAGDAFWLGQALANLIANALDFMPDGGELLFRLEHSGKAIHLSVFNPGQPVPEYALPQVFDRFYTLPRPDGRRSGSGLGLTLVREVMQQLGGDVRLANRPGGVEATLVFPAP